MKKIRLNLDRIEVETFTTTTILEEIGTVEAHLRSIPGDTWCGQECYTLHYGCFTNVC